jgi:hypothetical protein
MTRVTIEIGGEVFEGHCADTGNGLLRVISRYGSRSVPLGELALPPDLQAEMALAEIVLAFKDAAAAPRPPASGGATPTA